MPGSILTHFNEAHCTGNTGMIRSVLKRFMGIVLLVAGSYLAGRLRIATGQQTRKLLLLR